MLMAPKRTNESDGREAFRCCFEANFADVSGFARRRCASDDADAVVSETFLIAWRLWSRRPQAEDEVRPWLFGIARNVMRSSGRHEGRRREFENRSLPRYVIGGDEFESTCTDVDLLRALQSLRRDDQEVLLLVGWEDLDTAGLAVALGISNSAARVRLFRARSRLTKLLAVNDGTSRVGSESPELGSGTPEDKRIDTYLQRNYS
jgi:RNA polymerase sigma-70 factor, ECF subfamily